MNYSLQYYPDPGIAFDITKMLFVKLTPENIWKPMLTSFETSTQDFTYIQQRSEYFPVPKPELLSLFALKKWCFSQMLYSNCSTKGLVLFLFLNYSLTLMMLHKSKRICFYSILVNILMPQALNTRFEPVPLFLIKSSYFSSAFI